jgi:lipoyl(octanoyl) transferase
VEIRNLGLTDYEEVWALQLRLVEQRSRGEIPDTLLLCEHHPVYTRGASSKAPVPPLLPHPLHSVERGGDLTYHGPGQLIGYPILNLTDLGLRPRGYLRALEEALAAAVRPLGIEASALRGFTGLWAGGRKIASIGVAVKGGISYHGFALNVPCNLQPDQLTTLAAHLGHSLDAAEVWRRAADAMLERFAAPVLAA